MAEWLRLVVDSLVTWVRFMCGAESFCSLEKVKPKSLVKVKPKLSCINQWNLFKVSPNFFKSSCSSQKKKFSL